VECVFCEIVAGRAAASVVYDDDLVLAFCDIEPFTAGHTLIIPKRHAVGLSDVDAASAGLVVPRVVVQRAGQQVAELATLPDLPARRALESLADFVLARTG
jgi:diadenosine tetraphosphate (Ap4A) HIT family hydrolase